MSVEYGYNLAAAGMLTAMFRQEVASNNLANIETVGFKADMAFTVPRQAARVEDRLFNLPANKLLERLGAGVLLGPTRTSFTQGALERTGNPLDIAIRGDGFLTVSSGGGRSASGDQIRLTRDGRLTLDSQGTLVTVAGGKPVLDDSGRHIGLDRSIPIEIDSDGTIYQGDTAVARLRLVDVPNRQLLRKEGEGMYALPNSAAENLRDATGDVVQGSVEKSAVDAIDAMMRVQSATGAVTATGRMLSIHDELTGRMINGLGRATA
ncbi:MAG: flagellar hook basal-body protein [Phycisphaerales bacterium]|nr:flagellar hook basal-body protein [Phycisphaerales bacterium]